MDNVGKQPLLYMFLKQEGNLTVVICKEFHFCQCHNFIQCFSELNCPHLKLLLIDNQQRFFIQPLMISLSILHFGNIILVPKMGVQG